MNAGAPEGTAGNPWLVDLGASISQALQNLYDAIGGASDAKTMQIALLWVLNLSDGSHSLLDIADRAGLPFPAIRAAANLLVERVLLRNAETP